MGDPASVSPPGRWDRLRLVADAGNPDGRIDPEFTAYPLRALADTALERAGELGAQHADFRAERILAQQIVLSDGAPETLDDSEVLGLEVRVVVDGTWGFAATVDLTPDSAARAAAEAVQVARIASAINAERIELADEPAHGDVSWVSAYQVDPFQASLADKVDLLAQWSAGLLAHERIAHVDAALLQVRECKFYSDGATTALQQRVRVAPGLNCVAIEPDGRFETMGTLAPPAGRGLEYLGGSPWSTAGAPGTWDFPAALAGTSFATPDKLGSLRYGSPVMHITGDRTAQHGLASIGYDDEGVAAQSWDLVTGGIFTGYQVDRRMALLRGMGRSRGCAYADSPGHMPIQRMANVSLQPAPDGPSTGELIAGVKDGIYVIGDKSWSIDMQRYNFQFTGQRFYKIANGRLAGQLRDVAYQAVTTDFWNSMEAVGGPQTYVLGGAFNCGKGQPQQTAPVSHGCPAAVFRGIRILNTAQEGS